MFKAADPDSTESEKQEDIFKAVCEKAKDLSNIISADEFRNHRDQCETDTDLNTNNQSGDKPSPTHQHNGHDSQEDYGSGEDLDEVAMDTDNNMTQSQKDEGSEVQDIMGESEMELKSKIFFFFSSTYRRKRKKSGCCSSHEAGSVSALVYFFCWCSFLKNCLLLTFFLLSNFTFTLIVLFYEQLLWKCTIRQVRLRPVFALKVMTIHVV